MRFFVKKIALAGLLLVSGAASIPAPASVAEGTEVSDISELSHTSDDMGLHHVKLDCTFIAACTPFRYSFCPHTIN